MIKLFADGADMNGIIDSAGDPIITGFTTNPTLMRQAGVADYTKFSKDVISFLSRVRPDTCLSLEVFADDPEQIARQARTISDWGSEKNYKVYVKIPVMYTSGQPTYDLINKLSRELINLNVTAVFTEDQITNIVSALTGSTSAHIISIFAGRIADVGVDPTTMFNWADDLIYDRNVNIELLWASSREAYNYIQAGDCADIITMTPDLIKKVKGFGKDLSEFSKETCRMFYSDAVKSGFSI